MRRKGGWALAISASHRNPNLVQPPYIKRSSTYTCRHFFLPPDADTHQLAFITVRELMKEAQASVRDESKSYG